MKITKWMGALARALVRQLYRACIERCGLIAGTACCGDAAAAIFFDDALSRGR